MWPSFALGRGAAICSRRTRSKIQGGVRIGGLRRFPRGRVRVYYHAGARCVGQCSRRQGRRDLPGLARRRRVRLHRPGPGVPGRLLGDLEPRLRDVDDVSRQAAAGRLQAGNRRREGDPRASQGGRIWTLTLRSGFRFSDGTPIGASAFARAIHRTLAPGVSSPGAQYTVGIVGAKDVLSGKATAARELLPVATRSSSASSGRYPTSRRRRRCPSSARCRRVFPPIRKASARSSAGPYHVAEYRAGERIVLERNPHYGGARLHHVDGFLVDLRTKHARADARRDRAR